MATVATADRGGSSDRGGDGNGHGRESVIRGFVSCKVIKVYEIEGIPRKPLLHLNSPITSPSPSSSSINSSQFYTPNSMTPVPASAQSSISVPDNNYRNRWIQALVAVVFLLLCVLLLWQFFAHGQKNDHGCKERVIVDIGGGGQFRSITEAIQFAPSFSPYTFCIMIRQGEYIESITVPSDKTNLTFIGDGVGKTVISNLPSSDQPILWTKGDGFVAKFLSVKDKENASLGGVVLKNTAAYSVFFQCSLEGYSNGTTIFAERGLQLYRSCSIYGHSNIIVGDAAAVFQRCKIKAAVIEHLSHHSNIVITRQTRMWPISGAGFVFHLSEFSTTVANTRLGAPVNNYSLVMVMQSWIGKGVGGWEASWNTPATVSFLEFKNDGQGASVRTRSPSVHYVNNASDASRFTIRYFLRGGQWIPENVPYDMDLI